MPHCYGCQHSIHWNPLWPPIQVLTRPKFTWFQRGGCFSTFKSYPLVVYECALLTAVRGRLILNRTCAVSPMMVSREKYECLQAMVWCELFLRIFHFAISLNERVRKQQCWAQKGNPTPCFWGGYSGVQVLQRVKENFNWELISIGIFCVTFHRWGWWVFWLEGWNDRSLHGRHRRIKKQLHSRSQLAFNPAQPPLRATRQECGKPSGNASWLELHKWAGVKHWQAVIQLLWTCAQLCRACIMEGCLFLESSYASSWTETESKGGMQ